MRVLLTGGAGFLGLALARQLKALGAEPRLLDSLRHGPAQREAAGRAGLELVQGDVCCARDLEAALDGADRVVHLASIAGVGPVCERPVETMRIALRGTDMLLQACRGRRIERLVYASTSEVYGPRASCAREDDACAVGPVGRARWTYAAAKLACEHLVMACGAREGLPVAVLRPFNVYGPGQWGQGAVRAFVLGALEGGPLVLRGGGGQVRAWCYVDDFVQGALAALDRPEAPGRVFNLGNPEAAVSVRELAVRVSALAGGVALVEGDAEPDEVAERTPCVERAARLLGFAPRVDLDEGLRRTWDWYARAAGRRGGLP
ncbi:MAG: NAD(P)-dependent oxidoreductase [Deltaproteobacteria bacterium]|nr:NAD(P)-dependent oxidoreductase [Deltaproteobacteria bacterium]